VANLLNVSNATNRMQLKTARNLLALLQNASTAVVTTQPTSQDAPGINNNCIITNGQLLTHYTKGVPLHPPHPHFDTINQIFLCYKLHTLRPVHIKHGLTLQPDRRTLRTNNLSVPLLTP